MADVKISGLPAAAAVGLTDVVPIVQGGVTEKATVAQVRAAVMPVSLTADVTGALPLANQASPTGTGVTHVIAGVTQAAASPVSLTVDVTGVLPTANQASQTMAGDVTGTTGASVVAKVNGAAVATAAGALVTDKVLRVTGVSAADWGALNLAAAAAVTGVLPTANQASQAMAGDVTGTTAASTVAKANGATVPAAGALTTGNVLQVSGASALSYGALNLAGGANYVTGTLPAANQAAQTLAGDATGLVSANTVAKINGATVPAAGALTTSHVLMVSGASATSYGFIADANVSATAAVAGTKINPDFGSQNVFTTGYMAFGTPVAAVGTAFRFAINKSAYAKTSGTDRCLWEASDATLYLGNNASNASQFSTINIYGGGTGINLGGGATAATYMQIANDTVQSWKPITGSSGGSSPYSVHGAVVSAMTDADYTVPASEYSFNCILIPSSLTLTTIRAFKLPTPATEAASYKIDVQALPSGANAGVTVTRADGTGTTVSLGKTLRATIHMRPGGAQLAAPTVAGVA